MKSLTLGGGPSGHRTSELNTNELGGLQLPGEVGHDIDGISTSDTNSGHTETTAVGGVRVGTDEETTGESIVLENDLVDNTRARAPETKVVLGAGRGQEVVNFLVDADGAGKILLTTNLGLNQVVTVDGGRVGDGIHTSRHELEDGHLSSGVLASNAVGTELEVRLATLDFLAVRVIQMRVENLLGVGKGSVKTRSNDGEVLGHLLVVDEVAFFPDVLANLYCATLVSMVGFSADVYV